jgi:cytochrome c2
MQAGTPSQSPALLSWILWHLFAATILALVPSQVYLRAPVTDAHLAMRVGLAASYLASVLLVTWLARSRASIAWHMLVAASAAVFGAFFLFVLLVEAPYSRAVLLLSILLSAAFLALFLSRKRSPRPPALPVVAVLAIGTVLWSGMARTRRPANAGPEVRVLSTTFYNLAATSFRGRFDTRVPGGGVAAVDGDYLVATGEGVIYRTSRSGDGDSLRVMPLQGQVPINTSAFLRDAGPAVNTVWFRTADILVQRAGNVRRLLASHHYWKAEEGCYVVRVSAAEDSSASPFLPAHPLKWRSVYETHPCLRFKSKGNAFAGLHIGGRLVLLDDHRLLLSVGEHEFDGVDAKEMLSQDLGTSYGKTVLIDLAAGTSELYSLGHRNPQGLYATPSGTVWLTEHGPNGGDELNQILRGANYGWPLVTYGAARNEMSWPLSARQGRHDGFERPVYGWLPSIGVSNLIGIERDLFGHWRGDLLISSLRAGSLFRMRVQDKRVELVEHIRVGVRVRDVIEDEDGRIVLWTDEGTLVFIEPIVGVTGRGDTAATGGSSDPLRGALLFAACRGCHPVGDGTSHGIGPDLQGVVGRRIGAAPNYPYTRALRALVGTWTEDRISRFLADPQGTVPGSSMQSEGLPDSTDRRRLIEYLKTLR